MMPFNRTLVSLVLLHFGFDLFTYFVKAKDIEPRCNTTCECEVKQFTFYSREFLAICEGNGTENLVLNDVIFETESVPNWNRRVYVRVSNFSRVNVEDSFLSRWLAYATCSFDIWDSKFVSFPKETPPLAKTKASVFEFGGIGIDSCAIDEFPANIFKKRKKMGLAFSNSKINYLNIFKLGGKGLNYLNVMDSRIKLFDGKENSSLTLAKDRWAGDAYVKIEDSQVGYLSSNALSFNDYAEDNEANVTIKRSTVGIMEESAIELGQGVSLALQGSSLGHVLPFGFRFADGNDSILSITGNLIGTEDTWMKEFECNEFLRIEENFVYTNQLLSDCILSWYELPMSDLCNKSLEITNYFDSSCQNNKVVGKHYLPPLSTLPPPTTTTQISTTSTIRNTPKPTTTSGTTAFIPNTTFTPSTIVTTNQTSVSTSMESLTTTTIPCFIDITSSDNNSQSNESFLNSASNGAGRSKFSLGLLYLLGGLCLCLFIIVIILTAVLIWGKERRKARSGSKGESNSDSYHFNDSVMYFCPNPDRPLSGSFDKTRHDSKTEPLVLNE